MADYYSLLSRAVANLPKPSLPAARTAIYDRARKALNNQLRSLKPPLPEVDISREASALEAAVIRIEGEYTPSPPETPAAAPPAPLARPAAAPPRPAPPPKPSAPAVPRPASPTRPAAPVATAASAPPQPARPPAPPIREASMPPVAPPAVADAAPANSAAPPVVSPKAASRPTLGPRPLSAPTSPKLGSAIEPATAVAAPTVYAPFGEEPNAEAPPPLLKPALPLSAPPRVDVDAARPSAPRAEERSGGNRAWLWIALLLLIGIVGAVAVAAFVMRSQKPQDLAITEPTETAAVAAPAPNGQKILERVAGAPAPAATPTQDAAPPPSPTPTAPAAPAPTPSPSVSAAPAIQPTAPSAPTPAAVPSTGARAAMLVAEPQDVQKPTVSVGTATWSNTPANSGQPSGLGVKAEISIPELKMRATMIMRKNVDASLPASHTIDLRFAFDEGSPVKGVKDIGVPQMRRDDPPTVTPLLGVRVMIDETYFLVGLNRADADIQRNIDAIASSGWFDFPILLQDGRIAKLTFEKGPEGEKIVAAALASWK